MDNLDDCKIWESQTGLKITVIRKNGNLIEFLDNRSGAISAMSEKEFLSKYSPRI